MGKGTWIIITSVAIAGYIASSHGASIAASSVEEMPAATATSDTARNLPTGTGARVFTKKSGTVEVVYPGGSTDTGAIGSGAGGTTDADSQGGAGVKTGGSTDNYTGAIKGPGSGNISSGGDSGTSR